jgi:dipeptidyl aminopeptidase/acylaminoacyl peptidase
MSIFRFAPLALLLAAAPAIAGPGKGLTIDDMLAMQRVGEPAVSPDGKWVAFSVRDTDMAANKGRTDIWLAAVDGATVRRLTTDPASDTSPAWSPDGAYVYFASTRGGSSQVWRIAVAGGEAEAVTKLPIDVNGFRLFPDGKRLLLAMDVWPETRTLATSVAKDAVKSPSSAQAYDSLLFRHWDTWEDGKYSHLFVWSPDKPDDARDLLPGATTDTPTHPFGGMEDTAISPDGKTVAYVARVGGKAIAWTTNTDVFLVPADGVGKAVALTGANLAYDYAPSFAPDGKSLAVMAMARAGYEADRQRVVLYDLATKKPRTLTEGWDRSPGGVEWSADGKTLYTSADDLGNHSLFAIDATSGKVTTLIDKGTNASPLVAGDQLVFLRDTLTMPAELFRIPATGGVPRQITHFNDARVAKIAWGAYEQYTFTGAKGDTVYAYLVKPANFDIKRTPKVPVAVLIHGGPQGSFGDHFHYRWNPQVYAGHGYAAVVIDFHGSTGYGQAFTDAINGDWGGAPYDDIMAGIDAALKKYPFLDGSRMGAARRVVRRLHDQLDQRQDRSLQGAGLPRRQPRRAARLLRHRGAVVPRVGARRHPVGQPRRLRQAQPHRPRRQLEDPHPRRPRRPGLPRRRDPGHVHLHRPPAQRHPLPLPLLPRREPLGPQAPELQALARRSPRLAGSLPPGDRIHPSNPLILQSNF